jgi:RNAse (barnase) inhibitor barstar
LLCSSILHIAAIDGKRCRDIESFLVEIGHAFSFPEYYGRNMNALNDCLNDLDWIDKDSYVLIINHFESFISESEEDKNDVINFLNEIAQEWKNYDGADNDETRILLLSTIESPLWCKSII